MSISSTCRLQKSLQETYKIFSKSIKYKLARVSTDMIPWLLCVCQSCSKISQLKWSYDLRSYERNYYNCVEKPEKFRTSTGFEPVTSRFRCDALTNWAMKPLTLGAGHLWVLMVQWGMNQWWNGIWNELYMNWSPEFFRLLYAIGHFTVVCSAT